MTIKPTLANALRTSEARADPIGQIGIEPAQHDDEIVLHAAGAAPRPRRKMPRHRHRDRSTPGTPRRHGRAQANKVIAIGDEKAHGRSAFDNGAEAGLLPRRFGPDVCQNADHDAAAHRAGNPVCHESMSAFRRMQKPGRVIMTTRSRREQIIFKHSFRIKGIERELAAGTYEVVTDDEMIEGLSFPCFRRLATMIMVPGASPHSSSIEMISINPLDLATARDGDARAP
jgi:hypothetical protein